MCTLTVFQHLQIALSLLLVCKPGGFSSPVEKQELIFKGVCKRINRSKDRKMKRLRANEEWKKTDVPFALQTISSPWVLSPWLWTAIDSSLLMAPKIHIQHKRRILSQTQKQRYQPTKHLCSLRSERHFISIYWARRNCILLYFIEFMVGICIILVCSRFMHFGGHRKVYTSEYVEKAYAVLGQKLEHTLVFKVVTHQTN